LDAASSSGWQLSNSSAAAPTDAFDQEIGPEELKKLLYPIESLRKTVGDDRGLE